MVSFMVTNGGPHPADKWAEITTDTILGLIQIDESSSSPEAMAARQIKRELRPKMVSMFCDHHSHVQTCEREGCAKIKKLAQAKTHADTCPDAGQHSDVMDDLNVLLASTPFAPHFEREEVQAVLWQIVGQHTTDVMHIERRWHHDTLAAKES